MTIVSRVPTFPCLSGSRSGCLQPFFSSEQDSAEAALLQRCLPWGPFLAVRVS